MKQLLFFALCAAFFPDRAEANYTFYFQGKRYEIIMQKMTWRDAAAYAKRNNAHLAEIKDAAEQAAIWQAIQKSGVSASYTSVNDGGGVAYIWIGATDHGHEGKWCWDGINGGGGLNFWNGEGKHGKNNGRKVNNTYNNWGGTATGVINEPDNWQGRQNAAAIGLSGWPKGSGVLGHAGEWNDIDESNQLYSIITYNK